MIGRRTFLGAVGFGLTVGSPLSLNGFADGKPASGGTPSVGGRSAGTGCRLGAEGDPHEVTWMAYGATPGVWGEESSTAYGRVYLGDVPAGELPPIQTHPLDLVRIPINDLWVRDTGPVFVTDAAGKLFAVDLNFNGWGQEASGLSGWRKDAKKGLATESCILNPNRNPGKTKAEVEAELRRLFGVEQVLWLPAQLVPMARAAASPSTRHACTTPEGRSGTPRAIASRPS